jgi:hypothetical protein
MSNLTEYRFARRSDNAQLLELFGSVPMEGDLVLATRREPDFFALYDIQRGTAECLVSETNGVLTGVSTFLIRAGWLDGREQQVGYLGDLRTRFAARRAALVARHYQRVFDEIGRRHDCQVFLTAILASNQAALNALVQCHNTQRRQPYYHLLRRFSAVSVHFLRPHKPRQSAYRVRCAQEQDIPEIVALLDSDHRQRPFGYRFDQGEFEHRLKNWPGFSLANTYLAFDAKERLVGCTTAWDPSPVKRYQVNAYRGAMLWIKRGYNAIATMLRCPRLPAPGGTFRYFYLCNTSILYEHPVVLHSLLEHVYADFHPRGYHFFTLCIYEDDPLQPALKGFFTRTLPFHLYAVTSSDHPRTDFPPGRTGFEIALA